MWLQHTYCSRRIRSIKSHIMYLHLYSMPAREYPPAANSIPKVSKVYSFSRLKTATFLIKWTKSNANISSMRAFYLNQTIDIFQTFEKLSQQTLFPAFSEHKINACNSIRFGINGFLWWFAAIAFTTIWKWQLEYDKIHWNGKIRTRFSLHSS